MDLKFINAMMVKLKVNSSQRKRWVRFFHFVKTILVFKHHHQDNFLEWDGQKAVIFTTFSEKEFYFNLEFSMIFLSQRKYSLEQFCKKNPVIISDLTSLIEVTKYCKSLFDYGRF